MGPFMGSVHAAPSTPGDLGGGGYQWQDVKTIVDVTNNLTYKYKGTVLSGSDSGDLIGLSNTYEAIFVATSGSLGCQVPTNVSPQNDSGYVYDNKNLNYSGAPVIVVKTGNNKWLTSGSAAGTTQAEGAVVIGFTSVTSGGFTGCQVNPFVPITIGNASGSSIIFNWADKSTIVGLKDDQSWTYVNSDTAAPTRYYATPGTSNQPICHSWIQVKSPTSGDYFASSEKKPGVPNYIKQPNGCWVKFIKTYAIGLTANSTAAPGSGTGTTGSCDSGTDANGNCTPADDTVIDCGSGSFNWIVCPAIQLGLHGIQILDNFITNTLNIDLKPIFDTTGAKGSASNGYYIAWNSFRIIATALLVIGGLVMVASQALGFEFLDAYTIRKTLPRLVIAAIGISLSWPLMRLTVGFFDAAGLDVRAIIYSPFHTLAQGASVSVGAGVVSTIGVGAALLILGPASLTFILSAALAIFVGFLALVIRQIVIIMLIIVAPVAIACYILPNTQRAWNLWRENFVGLLVAFPVISALIAIGNVFAVVSLNGNTGTASLTAQAAGLVHHFTGHGFHLLLSTFANNTGTAVAQAGFFIGKAGPPAILPKIIMAMPGALSTLTGNSGSFLNNARDGLKKVRSNAAAKNIHDMKNGNRFKGDSWAANKFNRATETLGALPSAGFNPAKMGTRMQEHISRHQADEAAEAAEKNSAVRGIIGNDDFLTAGVLGKGNDKKVYDYLRGAGYSHEAAEQGTAAVRAARRSMNSEAFEEMAIKALPATGTAFRYRQSKDKDGNLEYNADGSAKMIGGAGEMHDFANKAANFNRVKANRMLAVMRTGAEQARRFDLAGGGFGSQSGVMEEQFQATQALAQGQTATMTTASGQKVVVNSAEEASAIASQRIFRESIEGKSGSYIAGGRKSEVEALTPVMVSNLNDVVSAGVRTGTLDKTGMARQLAKIADVYDNAAGAPLENQEVIANMMGQTLTAAAGRPEFMYTHTDAQGVQTQRLMTIREMVEKYREDPDFLDMRRELGSGRPQPTGPGTPRTQLTPAQIAAQQQQQANQPQQPPIAPLGGPTGGLFP